MRRRLVLIIILLLIFLAEIAFAEKKIVYNSEKGYYEVWDTSKNKLIRIIRDNEHSFSAKDVINVYPYQQGFPVLMPECMEADMNICDVDNDNKQELLFMTHFDWKMNMLDYRGIPKPNWENIIMYYLPACGDIDNDGYLDVAACANGAIARRYDASIINGFPYPPDIGFFSLSIEDINKDGNYEIAFGNYYPTSSPNYKLGLYVLGSWGSLLPGFPVIFPLEVYEPPAYSGENHTVPTVGDFDDDGYMEIAITTANGKFHLIRADGSHYRNWPVVFYMGGGLSSNMAAIADIDNDDKLELIITDSNGVDKLFVFNDDASIVNGFPVGMEYFPDEGADFIYESPSIADVDEDGNLEIFLATFAGCLFGFKNDGTNLPGWPIDVKQVVPNAMFGITVTIGDIDGDSEMEIIAARGKAIWCGDGVLVAYNVDGTLVSGFPIIESHYEFYSAPLLADLDNDGDIEICTISEYCGHYCEVPAYVYCYDLPYPYDEKNIAWGNWAHDYRHTGRYVNPKILPPEVLSITPNFASFKGGRIVEIKGKNFLAGAKVFFDGIPSEYVQVVDSNTIYAKVPPHKPCYMYINDTSVSPYELSEKLADQPVSQNELKLGQYPISIDNDSAANQLNDSMTLNGCVVNVVVAHPSPDQRQGVLRAAFTYTGYEDPSDDIILKVSKYAAMGTFENYGANWMYMNPYGLWNILEDSSTCLPRPYPSRNKVAYYGNKNQCNYNTPGKRNYGYLVSPAIKVDNQDAKIRFKYFRNVEYSPDKIRDILKIEVTDAGFPYNTSTIIWQIDSTSPSENQWVEVEAPIGQWQNKYDIFIVFKFDTVDEVNNSYKGIAIDNVELIGAHWHGWSDNSGEVILNWTGGLPKYLVYRNTNPDFVNNLPELRAYTPFNHFYENTLNDDKSYYYKVR